MEIPKQFQDFYKEHHFKALTPIQEQVYEPLKSNRSILAMAPTGSGKTIAFGMPMIENTKAGAGIQVLILEPSQELSIQTRDVLRQLTSDLTVYSVIGGANIKRQIEHLKKKPEIVVGTIGRITDLVSKKKFKLNKIQTVIIDEADEMLADKMDAVRSLLNRIPSEFQLGLFSATATPVFKDLTKWFNKQFVEIDLRSDKSFRAGLKHYFIQASTKNKPEILQQLAHRKNKTNLVFCQSSKVLHRLAAAMRYRKTYFAVLDTSDPKGRRETALKEFRTHKTSLLLTTDVAARGMDIPDLTTVINLENPEDRTEYIHRSGRTGRMGRNGEVITLGNSHDYRQLIEVLHSKNIKIQKSVIENDKLIKASDKKRPVKSAKRIETPKKKKRWRDRRNKGKH